MINLSVDEGFCLIPRDKNDRDMEYLVKVKYINELDSILLISGVKDGGYNFIFLANDNMTNRE